LSLVLAATACTVTDDNKRTTNNNHPDSGDGTGGSKADGSTQATGGAGGGGSVKDGGTPEAGLDGGALTVSGKIAVGDQLFVDSDTAEETIEPKSNDLDAPQNVASPGSIGGFLGPLRPSADPDVQDVYAVTLAAGDSATLYIGAPSDETAAYPDFDLYLVDATNPDIANPLDSSESPTSPIEVVQAKTAGNYLVVVTTGDDTSVGRYTLSLGTTSTTTAVRNALAHKQSRTFDFVPGEAIVKLKPGTEAVTKTWSTLHARPLGTSRNVLGSFHVKLDANPAIKGLGINAVTAPTTAATTIQALKKLQRDPRVLYAEPNYIRKINAAAPNDPLYKYQWHYPQVNLLEAWDHSRGADVIVAVIDTGVVKAHPDFVNTDKSSQLLAGYDMIADPDIAADGNGRDSDPNDPGDQGIPPDESSWHGSHVSGTIAAATGNGVGAAGVAPEAKILPVRCLGVGGGTTDDIVQGILYAAGLANDSGAVPAKKADVINMSLGGKGLSQSTAAAIAAARAAGTIVVVSSGNDDTNAASYSPAGEKGVVTVGAVDYSKKKASYSNYGSVLELVAPGGDESKDDNNDGVPDGVLSLVYARAGKSLYAAYEGTSMAAPHVSGIIALMKSAYPELTPDLFDTMMQAKGANAIVQDLGAAGKDDDYGYGLLNANLAVNAALTQKGGTSTPTLPVAQLSSSTLDFGAEETELPLEITNIGRGTLTVTKVAVTAPWAVTPGAVGTNAVTLNRTGLSDGVHVGTVSVTTNGGTVAATLRAVSGAATVVGGDVGPLYVLLVDPSDSSAKAQAVATAANGYAYTIRGVVPGKYQVVAGTDVDDNGIINDEGEAFGAYPLLSNPQILDVTESASDVSFPARFQFNVTTARAGARAGGVKYHR
jgi:serine protease